MKAVIISGGTPPSINLLKEELSAPHVLICADSGADCLKSYGITPHYLLGDFDSISKETLDFFHETSCMIENYPIEKDDTDTQLALIKALSLKAENIVFLGCTGSRLDHTLGNLGLLLQCLKLGIKAYIRDDRNIIWLADKPVVIYGEPGEFFSLLAYGSEVKNLSIKGARYNLNNYNLNLGSSLTVSNKFQDREVEVAFSEGIMLITKSLD